MPEAESKTLSVDNLRHAEYYGMQQTFDELYSKSLKGETFDDLVDIIFRDENIMLAYRNIKTNTGSKTPGTDGITIKDLGQLPQEELINKVKRFVLGSEHGYRPKPVRRKDIPKPNGKTRPLGIPCMYDRLIQQCIKQVMEPICEAKFSDNSYGFRPDRSVENAISRCYSYIQISKLLYVVEFDIKGFFDNVDHSKLIKQIWAMGIHDKKLIYIIKRILKAPIKMPNGEIIRPEKGTPQGGIISPLLANIVLNELDHWVESQWQTNPITNNYHIQIHENGSKNVGTAYREMRKTNLKEMYMVRYADDFRIFCRNKEDAERVKIAVTDWLKQRLKLEISIEKTKVANLKKQWMNFLGFKMRAIRKQNAWRVTSRISDEQLERERINLTQQAKNVAHPRKGNSEYDEILLYNTKVMGVQNYYQIATNVQLDLDKLFRQIMTIFTNRLRTRDGSRLRRSGRPLTKAEKKRYGNARTIRYVAGTGEPLYPLGAIQHKNPMAKKRAICRYTPEGRKLIHENLTLNTNLLMKLMREKQYGSTIEYMDNRLSLFSAQNGRCAITGYEFVSTEEIHCHHKKARKDGGTDKYDNLMIVHVHVHKLIHATQEETIEKYKELLSLTPHQTERINDLREKLGLKAI